MGFYGSGFEIITACYGICMVNAILFYFYDTLAPTERGTDESQNPDPHVPRERYSEEQRMNKTSLPSTISSTTLV